MKGCSKVKLSISLSLIGFAHNTMKLAIYGKKMLRRPYQPWEVCTWMMGRFIDCSETSAPSIANVDMLWGLSQLQTGLSDTRLLSRRALYWIWVRWAIQDDLIEGAWSLIVVLDPWRLGASIMMRHCSPGCWFGTPFESARGFLQCIGQFCQSALGHMKESIAYTFFHCLVI